MSILEGDVDQYLIFVTSESLKQLLLHNQRRGQKSQLLCTSPLTIVRLNMSDTEVAKHHELNEWAAKLIRLKSKSERAMQLPSFIALEEFLPTLSPDTEWGLMVAKADIDFYTETGIVFELAS